MAYFANGTEGGILEAQCSRCPLGQKPCPVVSVQLTFNYKQCDKGQEQLRAAMNLLIDENGVCKLLPLIHGMKNEPEGLVDPLARLDEGWK